MLIELKEGKECINRMDPNLAKIYNKSWGKKSVNKERDQLSVKEGGILMILNERLNCLGEFQFYKKEEKQYG